MPDKFKFLKTNFPYFDSSTHKNIILGNQNFQKKRLFFNIKSYICENNNEFNL